MTGGASGLHIVTHTLNYTGVKCQHTWRSSFIHSINSVVVQVEKAPLESYADVGGLEQQVQEIKEAVELPLTNPELYEDIGIKPPKVGTLFP
jgi:ATP-dependent 26S proteasome regulatory subunit